jgi:uncharacterized protein YerC
MGRVSKRQLKPAIEERLFEIFWDHLALIDNPILVREFLQSLLSDTEHLMLAKRLAIAVLLSRGYSYEYIDDTLKVSKSTISVVDRQLVSGASGYKKAIDLVKRKKQTDSVWDSLEEFLLQFSPPARFGSMRHQIKSALGKSLYKRKYQREVI